MDVLFSSGAHEEAELECSCVVELCNKEFPFACKTCNRLEAIECDLHRLPCTHQTRTSTGTRASEVQHDARAATASYSYFTRQPGARLPGCHMPPT